MNIGNIEVVTVDAEMAEKMLTNMDYERQRKVNPHTVTYYAKMMAGQQWLPGSEIDVALAPNGDGNLHSYLVNGRHRLRAVVESSVPVQFVIKEYLCADSNEVGHLYGMLDTGRSRNLSDLIRGLGVAEQLDISPALINRVGAAAAFIANEFRHGNKYMFTPDERVEAVRKWAETSRRYAELVHVPKQRIERMYLIAAVMAVGLVTLEQSTKAFGEDRVEAFWRGAAQDDGLHRDDPRKVLSKFLIESALNSAKPSDIYSARYAAFCFNAWVQNRRITFTKVTDATAPINIAGSQFKGK